MLYFEYCVKIEFGTPYDGGSERKAMATDTVAKIKEAEGKYRRDCDDAVRESSDAVNRTKSDCDVRLTEARAECEREFAAARERADEEATKTSVLAERETMVEAEELIRSRGAYLPEAVRLIVGRIVGKWQ